MKSLFVTLFSFLSLLSSAQNQRFIYEYKFVKDSTDKSTYEVEMMNLDVIKRGSKFYSYKNYVADSLTEERSKKGSVDFSGIDYGSVYFVVEKSYPDFQVVFFSNLDIDIYKVPEKRIMNWKIHPDKEKTGEFDTQKATLDFAGRKWTAWFTAEIPIQDGPYKFHGLPGMIIKLEDHTKTHSFVLKGIKKLSGDQQWKSETEKERFGTLIEADQKKYKKQFIDVRKNPTKGMRQTMSSNEMKMMDEKGNPIDMEKMMRDIEKNVKEENLKDNNLLELDLLQ